MNNDQGCPFIPSHLMNKGSNTTTPMKARCAPFHDGILCAGCVEGASQWFGKCLPCDGSVQWGVVIGISVFVFALFVLPFVKAEKLVACLDKRFVNGNRIKDGPRGEIILDYGTLTLLLP